MPEIKFTPSRMTAMPVEHEELMQQHLREENLPEAVMPAMPVRKVLQGQKAIVTGASSGIGQAVAIALAHAGADVVVNYASKPGGADEVVKEATKCGVNAFAFKCNVSKEDEVQAMFKAAIQKFGTVDILVNNAGLQKDAKIEDMTLAQWQGVLDVNLTGQFLCSREAIREFKRRGIRKEISCAAGKIICMSSVHEGIPWAGHVNYAASIAVTNAKINPSRFQKTMAINDFYWGEPGYEFPMGNIQLMGKTVMDGLVGQEAKYAPLTLEEVAKCSVDWWLTTEDLPDARNQVRTDGDKIVIDYTENNSEPFARLNARWKKILREIDSENPKATTGYFRTKMPMHSLGHQVGTCKCGEDPKTSVLDLNCRAHDVDNLYVVDGSFFVSSGAVNPTLTIVANALRVGDHLLERFGKSETIGWKRNCTLKDAVLPEMASVS